MNTERLDRFLASVHARGVPALDIMIKHRGQTVYRHQEGVRDLDTGERLQGNELYYLYSDTKPITCVAALTLYEEGAFLLSDPVGAYLPEFASVRVQRIHPDGTQYLEKPARPITMRHLFTMTSGLDYTLDTPEIQTVIAQTQGKAPTREIVKAIAKRPLCFHPGEHFLYGLSHDVLAAVVEEISGKRFADFVKERIFDPCGMQSSCFHLRPEDQPRLVRLYNYHEETRKCFATNNKNHMVFGPCYDSGGAGCISSVEDYIKFEEMLVHGGITESGYRILSPGTIELMRTNHLGPQQLADFNWERMLGYGYGLGVRTMMDRTLSGSTGSVGEFGWGGLAGAYALIDPQNELTVCYAQHMLNNMESYIQPRLRNIIYASLQA